MRISNFSHCFEIDNNFRGKCLLNEHLRFEHSLCHQCSSQLVSEPPFAPNNFSSLTNLLIPE